MLATVGFLVQQKFHFLTAEADPLKAITALGYGPNLQILAFMGLMEIVTWSKTFSDETVPGRYIAPLQSHANIDVEGTLFNFPISAGDFGFDPLNLSKGKSKKDLDVLQLKEIKNGRIVSGLCSKSRSYYSH